MSEAQINGLANDLESLAAGTVSEADFRDKYAAEEAPAVLHIIWPNLEHYLADADIRRRDPSYRAMQDTEMAKLVRLLRAGAPDAELAKVDFLGRS
jgi:hypothetical protein